MHEHLFSQTGQMSMNRGIKEFGSGGTETVHKEMKQLHERKVPIPVDPAKLSKEDRKSALQYLMFLKRKRDGSIKAVFHSSIQSLGCVDLIDVYVANCLHFYADVSLSLHRHHRCTRARALSHVELGCHLETRREGTLGICSAMPDVVLLELALPPS